MESVDSYYDYDSTIFSPDGRLFQVEYARETIKKGSTTIGLKFNKGVILATYKNINTKLIEKSSIEKISQIDESIISAYVGLSADARHLVSYSQEVAAVHKIVYNEEIIVKNLVEEICNYKQLFTLYNGLRPFGLILMIAGIDSKGIHLYATDPSGAFLEYKAICEGEKNKNITKYFEKNYKESLTKEDALKFLIKSIEAITRKKINAENFEICIIKINKNNNKYFKLTEKEIKNLLN